MTPRHRTSPAHRARFAGLLLGVTTLAGCSDFNITGWNLSDVAVTAGDFDNVAAPLDRMVVPHRTYEGIISVATWDPSYDYQDVAYKVEDLLGSSANMSAFSTIFVASGTRGLGQRVYNGLEPDDELVSSPDVLKNTREYVKNGGVLVVTDWAYDLVEQSWPDEIDFEGDDTVYDAAQTGEIGRVAADIVDPEVADALGYDTMGVTYDYSNWAVIQDVAPDVRVIVQGSPHYHPDGQTSETLQDKPLMVVFQPPGARGKVVLTTFHIDAQTPEIMDALITAVVGNFQTDGGGTVAVQ